MTPPDEPLRGPHDYPFCSVDWCVWIARLGMNRADAFSLISAERNRQQAKWARPHPWGKGDCSSPHVAPIVKAAVLAEECGEVARAVLDMHETDLRTELVQTAAVAVAWLESLSLPEDLA